MFTTQVKQMETRSSRQKGKQILNDADLVSKEHDFFRSRLEDGLERARIALSACKRGVPNSVSLESLSDLFASLGGEDSMSGRVFRSMFRQDEWKDLCESDEALRSGGVRDVRSERQKRVFETMVVADGLQEVIRMLEQLVESHEGDDESREMHAQHKRSNLNRASNMSSRGNPKSRKKAKASSEDDEVVMEPRKKSKGEKEEVQEEAAKEEQEEDGEEDACVVEEEPTWDDVLERMKTSVAVVVSLQKLSGSVLPVGSLVAPDPQLAGVLSGKALTRDPKRLMGMMLAEPSLPVSAKLGRLTSWWDVCRRCFSVAGVLAYLRTEKKSGTTLRQRYGALAGRTYEQATRYDKLARVLLEYPLLVYQIELISLKGWTRWLARSKTLFIPDMWREKTAPVLASSNVSNECWREACVVCGTGEQVAELWHCDACGYWFHDTCSGYRHGSLVKEVEFGPGNWEEVAAYCERCLHKNNMCHMEVVKQAEEIRAVGNFLCMPDCPFTLERVAGDGYCIFSVLETFAREEFNFLESSDVFCGMLAESALVSFDRTRLEMGEDAVEHSALQALKKLQNVGRQDRVLRLKKGLWKEIEVEHLLNGFVSRFPGSKVYVFRACNGVVMQSGVSYGEVEGKALHVLEWAFAQHKVVVA